MKSIVLGYCRAAIPTRSHNQYVDSVRELAEALDADYQVYITNSTDRGFGFLSESTRLGLFDNPTNVLVAPEKTPSLIQILRQKNQDGYKDVHVCLQSHQVDIFSDVLKKYNKKEYDFNGIYVVNYGDTVDDETVHNAFKAADYDKIRDILLLKNNSDVHSLIKEYHDVVSEYDLRDSYKSGEHFCINDLVEDAQTQLPLVIVECESNYVWAVDPYGERQRYWLDSLVKVNSTGTIFESTVYGFTPSHLSEEMLVKVRQMGAVSGGDPIEIIEAVKELDSVAADKILISERRRIAAIFAKSVGVSDSILDSSDPKMIVEAGLRELNKVTLTPDGWKILGGLLASLHKVGIDFSANILSAGIRQQLGLVHEESDIEHELDRLEHNLSIIDKDIANVDSEEELMALVNSVDADSETDEAKHTNEGYVSPEELHEAISAQSRLKRAISLRARKGQLAAKRKLSLHRYASKDVIEKRAKRAAIAIIKKRITHGRKNLSIAEKVRIESIIKQRSGLVKRTTLKLIPTVRRLSIERLSKVYESHDVKAKQSTSFIENFINKTGRI
jgi:hypothetical protein